MRCKTAAIALIATSFFAGVMFSEPIKDAKKYLHYETEKGFYEKPYNLKIEKRKNLQGKIETYLIDKETRQYQKIGMNMYVGDYKHRIRSAMNIPKEIAEENELLKLVSDIYSFIFDED